jgi:hypothetical protein
MRIELRNQISDILAITLKKFKYLDPQILNALLDYDVIQCRRANAVHDDPNFLDLVRKWRDMSEYTPNHVRKQLEDGTCINQRFTNKEARYVKYDIPLKHGKAGEVHSFVLNALNRVSAHFAEYPKFYQSNN